MTNDFKIITSFDDTKGIINYLTNNDKYPFKQKRMRIMIVNNITNDLTNLIKELFFISDILIYQNHLIIFYNDEIDELPSIIDSIVYDLGINFKVHNGIFINKNNRGKEVINYINMIINYLKQDVDIYTDLVSPLLVSNYDKEYLDFFKKYVLKEIIKDPITKDIILNYFKNDLNVLKTSKQLYLNRNSILNRFDNINKNTGINLQKFNHAALIYILLNHN